MAVIKGRIQWIGCKGARIVAIHFHQAADQVARVGLLGGKIIGFEFVAAGKMRHQGAYENGEHRQHKHEQDQCQCRCGAFDAQSGVEPGLL